MTDERAVNDDYEEAETRFLAAVRDGNDRAVLQALAAEVAVAAKSWESSAYPAFFAERERSGGASREAIELEIDAERAELLRSLWNDVAAAFAD